MNWRTSIFVILILAGTSCKKKGASFEMTRVDSGTTEQLRAIQMHNATTGYIAGGERYESGVILRTTTGGATWAIAETSDKALFDLSATSAQRVFAGGIDGRLHRSYDEGQAWTKFQSITYKDIYGVAFRDGLIGVAVGGIGYSAGVLHRTTNGGFSWEEDTLDRELRDAAFVNLDVAYVCGFGLIMRSDDAGETWEGTTATGDFFNGLACVSTNLVYACGYNGTIVKTTDGGKNWKKQRNGSSIVVKKRYLHAIQFFDADQGYAVGRDGLILYTENGGEDWFEAKSGVSDDLYDIWLTSAKSGIIVGDGGSIYNFSR
jgi:photosystem II stability/assembly factor-like uncharacterized protein